MWAFVQFAPPVLDANLRPDSAVDGLIVVSSPYGGPCPVHPARGGIVQLCGNPDREPLIWATYVDIAHFDLFGLNLTRRPNCRLLHFMTPFYIAGVFDCVPSP